MGGYATRTVGLPEATGSQLRAQQANWGGLTTDVDFGQLEGLGAGGTGAGGGAITAGDGGDIDWGILGDLSGGTGKAPQVDDDDGFMITVGAADHDAIPSNYEDGDQDDDEDDEFTVFDGFGKDNRPVRGASKDKSLFGGSSNDGAGLSWDEERKMWEKQNKSVFGTGGRRSSISSPWDLRSAVKQPVSLQRIRMQAEKLFEGDVSNSLFKSPTMQRFKRQTDDLLSDVRRTLEGPINAVTSYFREWFS